MRTSRREQIVLPDDISRGLYMCILGERKEYVEGEVGGRNQNFD